MLTHTLTHNVFLTLTHTLTYNVLLRLTHTLTHNVFLTLTHTLTYNVLQRLTHTLTHNVFLMLTHTLTYNVLLRLTHTLTHNVLLRLTHTLTYNVLLRLTHTLTYNVLLRPTHTLFKPGLFHLFTSLLCDTVELAPHLLPPDVDLVTASFRRVLDLNQGSPSLHCCLFLQTLWLINLYEVPFIKNISEIQWILNITTLLVYSKIVSESNMSVYWIIKTCLLSCVSDICDATNCIYILLKDIVKNTNYLQKLHAVKLLCLHNLFMWPIMVDYQKLTNQTDFASQIHNHITLKAAQIIWQLLET